MEYGWAGSGSYLTAPVTALSTELTGLASSSSDVLAVSAPFANSQGAVWADIEFIAGGACSPGLDAFLEVWVLRSLDGGLTFEDGAAATAPARGPDATIEINTGTSITPHAGFPGVMLPPGTFKIALRNQMGVAIPSGSSLRFAVYSEGSGADSAVLSGDASGTTALRIADMMERFGVVTYSQSVAGTNPWGAGVSDYTTGSVISALTWLTANSGMTCNLREYHVAGRDTGAGSNQLSWCPTVASATGSKFSVSLLRGAVSADATSLAAMAVSSADGTGWMTWAEGLNTPNDGSISAANCVAVQQALYSGVYPTSTKSHPVSTVGPSYTYNTLPPETSTAIASYLTTQQKSDLLASSCLASVRFFPTLDPEADDSAGRGGNADDVALGHGIYFGKPMIMGEWHPTSGNTDSPSHATDDSFGALYAALGMLNFHRLGYEAWFWKSLFDIGQSGDSPFTRVGLFPNSGSGTPRLPARTIRAMYALTGDTGAKKRTFRPSKLDYTITGLQAPGSNATPWTGGHHRLYQNSGGTFFLFVWNEQRPILGTGATVTVSFVRTLAQVVHYDLTTDATTAETPVATLTNIATLSFSLTASVHLLVIFPQGSTIPTESAQGSTLTTASGSLHDAAGIAYSLVANPPNGFQVNHGGVTDSSNVVLLLYWDHQVWQQTSTGSWFFWSGTAWVLGADPRIVATESPDGMTINGPGTTIFASQTPGSPAGATLDQWTIDSSAQMVQNGVANGSTANVMQAYYHLHTLFIQQTAGNAFGTPGWSSWNGSSFTAVANPFGTVESSEGTQISSIGPTINASTTPGAASTTVHVWALTDPLPGEPAFRMTMDGVLDSGSWGVDLLFYHNHSLFQRTVGSNSLGTPAWYVWVGPGSGDWTDTSDPMPSQPTETTSGTFVTTVGTIILASRTPGQASAPGAPLDQWQINPDLSLSVNGSYDGTSANVAAMYYSGHFMYHTSPNSNQLGDVPGWWRWDGTAWIDVHDPRGTVPARAITLANIPQVIESQTFGVTGTLSGYTSPPSLQYRDGSGGFVALPVGAVVTATSFSFTHPAMTIGTASSPAPAAAVGFNLRTAGPGLTLGTNWFYSVDSSLATQGAGGVVTVKGDPNGYHANDHINMFNGSGLAVGGGAYIEVDMQLTGTVLGNSGTNGWPAVWCNGIEGVFGGYPNNKPDQVGIEWDAFEQMDATNTGPWNSGIILWDGSGHMFTNTDAGEPNGVFPTAGSNINQRHKYSWLWVAATASTQGYIKGYFDGVQVGRTFTWTPYQNTNWANTHSNPWSVIDTQHNRWMIGCGTDNTMIIYSFAVWQASDSGNVRVGVALPTQSGGGSGSTSSVSVRDAGNTAIQATSNTFTIIPAGALTLTGITLSGTTVVAGSGAGTPIGNIAVQASGGTFSGTLAVNDTAHFRIVGTALQLATTLAVGNYPINITATQPGASASPMVRSFTIQAAASGNTSVNFSAPTGKTLNKTMFGFSTSLYGGQWFTNATFRNTANTFLKPACLWFNCDWTLDVDFANGNMTNINAFLGNYRSFCQTGVRVIMGLATSDAPTVSASVAASRAANFASYLMNNGFSDIMDFSAGNNWQNHGVSQATMISYFNAISDALHGVNPSYRVWGPPQWDPTFYANSTFGNSPSMATRCAGVIWMSYHGGGPNTDLTTPLDTMYGGFGVATTDSSSQRSALANTPLANHPLAVIEYNMGENDTRSDTLAQNGRYMGAIYAACYLYGLFKNTTRMEFACWQNIVMYADEGVIGSRQQGGNLTAVTAAGYFLGKAGQSLFGPEYTVTTSIANLAILAVKPSSTTFAIMLINYDLTNARTVNLSVSAGGVPTGTITRWEIGKSSPGAPITPTPVIGTQASLATIAIASETVVILTGTLA